MSNQNDPIGNEGLGGSGRNPGENGAGNLNSAPRSHFTIAINYATLSGNGDQPADGQAANTTFTPMILRFADVPSDTSSGRLNEVIALASEYIFQTLTRDQRRRRGLTREAFEKLEVRDVNNLEEKTCSICYDELVNDPKDFVTVPGKRSREEGDGTEIAKKRQHSDEPQDLTPATPNNHVDRSNQPETVVPPIETDADTATERRDTTQIVEEEERAPTYGHSATVLPCGHVFGRECLYKWTLEHNSCPICRAPIYSEEELQGFYNREDEANRGQATTNNESDAAQQSTFESIRRLLYERTPEPAVSNTINERVPQEMLPPPDLRSATNSTTTATTSPTTGTPISTASQPTSRTNLNTPSTNNNSQTDATQDITNNTNNQGRTFSTSFIFFLSDIHAHPPTVVTNRRGPTDTTSTAGNEATTNVQTDGSQRGSQHSPPAQQSVASQSTDTIEPTAAPNGRNRPPMITHFNDLPEENQRLLGNIRAILRRAHDDRSADSNDNTNPDAAQTGDREETANILSSDNETNVSNDTAHTTRRLFNLLPLLGRRQQHQTNDTQTNSPTTRPPPANPQADPALENRYSAYLEHLNTLRNGNSTASEPHGSRFRLPSFFRLGRHADAHRHEGGNRTTNRPTTSDLRLSTDDSNMFSSGVASYRHANGVRTINFTGDIPDPPNLDAQRPTQRESAVRDSPNNGSITSTPAEDDSNETTRDTETPNQGPSSPTN